MTNRYFAARNNCLAVIAVAAALLAPLTTFTLRAQQSLGGASITGVVLDPEGARVPNAQVTATNSSLGNRERTVTNSAGSYTLTNIPAGHYRIEILSPGFATLRLDGLAVVNGGTLQADAHLDPVIERGASFGR